MPTREQITEALKAVIDPELRKDIVELEMVRAIDIKDAGVVDVTVSLTTPGCPIKNHFQTAVVKSVSALDGVTRVNVGFDVLSDQEKQGLQRKLGRPGGLPEGAMAQVSNVICVGSGKGGVGKSSLTVNLAAALVADGKKVGVLDADVWGYSIPRMLGLGGQRPKVSGERKILPLESHGIKVMSIGFFIAEDEAVVWRGPMLHKALTQFLEDVAWGELDFLLIDLPPGTGDVSMTLAQLLPQAKFVLVTTPQAAAQKVARRAAEMAHKVNLEIAGVVENMSGFTTPGGERFTIFGEGGGQLLADELDVPLLGKVPLTMPLRETSDAGLPLVETTPDDPAAQAIRQAARGIVAMAPVDLPVMQEPHAAAARRHEPADGGLSWSSTATCTSSTRGSRWSRARATSRSRSRPPTTARRPRGWASPAARWCRGPSRASTRRTCSTRWSGSGPASSASRSSRRRCPTTRSSRSTARACAPCASTCAAAASSTTTLAHRVHGLAGWHAEVYAGGADLAAYEDRLRALPRLSIDHLGLDREALPVLLRLVERGAMVKATGFGRVDFDVAATLRAIDPAALLFGTDLPGTRARRRSRARTSTCVAGIAPAALDANARAWYGPRRYLPA